MIFLLFRAQISEKSLFESEHRTDPVPEQLINCDVEIPLAALARPIPFFPLISRTDSSQKSRVFCFYKIKSGDEQSVDPIIDSHPLIPKPVCLRKKNRTRTERINPANRVFEQIGRTIIVDRKIFIKMPGLDFIFLPFPAKTRLEQIIPNSNIRIRQIQTEMDRSSYRIRHLFSQKTLLFSSHSIQLAIPFCR